MGRVQFFLVGKAQSYYKRCFHTKIKRIFKKNYLQTFRNNTHTETDMNKSILITSKGNFMNVIICVLSIMMSYTGYTTYELVG